VVAGLSLVLVSPATGAAGKKRKAPSGITGTVVNSSCRGPCVEPCNPPCVYPPSTAPPYTGEGVKVEVRRAATGALVATRHPTDGRFRVKVKRGLYMVSAYLNGARPNPTPRGEPMVYPPPPTCGQSDSEQVRVHRHRFSPVELQLTDVCIL
jgi:hypothetical protein